MNSIARTGFSIYLEREPGTHIDFTRDGAIAEEDGFRYDILAIRIILFGFGFTLEYRSVTEPY